MKNVIDFLIFGASHATPARIPQGSRLCTTLATVGSAGVWQYLFGTTGRKCTKSLLGQKYEQYYKGWGWSRSDYDNITAGWAERGAMVCDCQGLEDCFSASDTNAAGNYAKYCTDKGRIQDITRPWRYGEALFVGANPEDINHVGWVVGFAPDNEPLILHERGIAHGCVIERMSACGKKWSYRGLMTKRYTYDDIAAETRPDIPNSATVIKLTTPMMRSGAIKDLQDALIALGYDCGTADGVAGKQTMAGIAAFCAAHSAPVEVPATLPEALTVTVEINGTKYAAQAKKEGE